MGTPLTAAQNRVLADIKADPKRFNGAQSNTRIGQVVARLVRKGAVTAHAEFVPAVRTYNGRRVAGFTCFGNVKAAVSA